MLLLLQVPPSKCVQRVPLIRPGQCRRYGGGQGDRAPPNDCLCSPISVYSVYLLKHHVTTRQQIIMEQRIITLKDNSRIKFFRFFAKLLATNCCTKMCDAIIRLINTPLRMCRGIGMYRIVTGSQSLQEREAGKQ